MVHVISIDGKHLMPMSRHGKVRRMLRDKKAKVVKVKPFTIKLLYKTETEVVDQELLDALYNHN